MNAKVHRITLDLARGKYQQVLHTQALSTGDIIEIALRVASLPYKISDDCTAVLHAEKPDGTEITWNCVCDDDKVTVEVTEQILAAPGTVVCQLWIFDGEDKRLFSPRFELVVWENNSASGVVSSNDYATLAAALAQATEAVGTADAAATTAGLAANNADSKAAAANTAANSANTAADAANTAAANANDKADAANAAATTATQAAAAALAASGNATLVYTKDEMDAALAGKAAASHTHSALDITEDTLPAERGGTGQTSLKNAANSLINSLQTGNDNPVDADYYVSQWANGGTDNTTFVRRPLSKLWNYIKSKTDGLYSAIGHTHSNYALTTHNHDSVYAPKPNDTVQAVAVVGNDETFPLSNYLTTRSSGAVGSCDLPSNYEVRTKNGKVYAKLKVLSGTISPVDGYIAPWTVKAAYRPAVIGMALSRVIPISGEVVIRKNDTNSQPKAVSGFLNENGSIGLYLPETDGTYRNLVIWFEYEIAP